MFSRRPPRRSRRSSRRTPRRRIAEVDHGSRGAPRLREIQAGPYLQIDALSHLRLFGDPPRDATERDLVDGDVFAAVAAAGTCFLKARGAEQRDDFVAQAGRGAALA